MIKHIQILFIALLFTISGFSQIQIGQDIDYIGGAYYNALVGHSISMPDEFTVVIGAPHYHMQEVGQTKVFNLKNGKWVQKGQTFFGGSNPDHCGWSVSMPDSNTLAIGTKGTYINKGVVRIYRWNGTLWIQKGADIIGENSYTWSGWSLSMPDSNTVAIGAPRDNNNFSYAGQVRIYSWKNNTWTKKGSDIHGLMFADHSGHSISMPDSNTLAVGAVGSTTNNPTSGNVRIYQWIGNNWIRKGIDIIGEGIEDRSGWSVSMPDKNTVAIGTPDNAGGASGDGQSRVFRWNGSAWVQKGLDIEGNFGDVNLGFSVCMPNSNTLALGSPLSENNKGLVRIMKWDGSNWMQPGPDIIGDNSNKRMGWSLSMPNESTIAIQGYNIAKIYSLKGISGSIYNDINQNCLKDTSESGIVSGLLGIITPGNHIVQTSALGVWHMDSLASGTYTITYDLTNDWISDCSNTQTFTVTNPDSSYFLPSFGMYSTNPCSSPEVSIHMPRIRPGFSNQNIFVKASNNSLASGSLVSSYVLIELDSLITPDSSSIPYSVQGKALRFDLGDINPGNDISFSIATTVSVSSKLGQTLCIDASIYPIDSCVFDTVKVQSLPPIDFTPCSLPWDKSSISVDGWCANDSIYFTINNTGIFGGGDMQCYSPVRLYIDGNYMWLDSIQLFGQETDTLVFAGDGKTWRLEVDQHPLHPGNSNPNASIELCGDANNWTQNLVTILPQDDAEPIKDIYCGIVTGSFDPNDKTGYPLGVSDSHFILPNKQMDYLIRFQNTGTDTAFTVVIRDTLESDLNIFSFKEGVSSHSYNFKMYGQNILEWTFDDILLPDSNTDLEGSNGFVKFTVDQTKNLTDYTELTNSASIFFDFNSPVVTNKTSHFVKKAIQKPIAPMILVKEVSCMNSITYEGIVYNSSKIIYNISNDTLYKIDLEIGTFSLDYFVNDTVLCLGDTLVLEGTGPSTFVWNHGVTDGISYLPDSSRTYVVIGTDIYGCSDSDSVFVKVNSLPLVDAGTDTTLCSSDTILISGNGAQNYSWDNGITNGQEYIGISDQTFIVVGTDINGCQNSDTLVLKVNSLPNVYAGNDTLLCDSTFVLNGHGAQSYIWNKGVTDGDTFIITSPEEYTVTGRDSNGCVNYDLVSVDVQFATEAGFDYLLSVEKLFLVDSSSTNSTLLTWSVEDSIYNDDILVHEFSQNGTYKICLIASNECFSDTVCKEVNVTSVGLEHNINSGIVHVYPNPASSYITFDFLSTKVDAIKVINIVGKIVDLKVNESLNSLQYDISHLEEGLYIYELLNDNEVIGIGEFIKR